MAASSGLLAFTQFFSVKTWALSLLVVATVFPSLVVAKQESMILLKVAPGSGGILTMLNGNWMESRVIKAPSTSFYTNFFIKDPVCLVQDPQQPMWIGIQTITVGLYGNDNTQHLVNIKAETIKYCADKWLPNNYLSWDGSNNAWWLTENSKNGNLVNLQIGPSAWYNDRPKNCDDIAVCISKNGKTLCSPNYTCSLEAKVIDKIESHNTTRQ